MEKSDGVLARLGLDIDLIIVHVDLVVLLRAMLG